MPSDGMELLRGLQHDATDDSVPVSRLLRKASILAARLAYAPLEQWVAQELNGYGSEEDLPDYRKLHGLQSKGTFVGPFGSQMKNALIPRTVFPTDLQDLVGQLNLFEPVAAYESLVGGAQAQGTSVLHHPWPDDTVQLMAGQIYAGWNCLEAFQVLPVSALAALLDRVRTATLRFSLEVERLNPAAADAPAGSALVPEGEVAAIFRSMLAQRL